MRRRRPGVEILDEKGLALQIAAHSLGERGKAAGRELLVDAAPPDFLVHIRLIDDEFVLGGAAGVRARAHDQRPIGRELALAALKRQRYERSGLKIGIDGGRAEEPRPAQRCSAKLPGSRKCVHQSGLRL